MAWCVWVFLLFLSGVWFCLRRCFCLYLVCCCPCLGCWDVRREIVVGVRDFFIFFLLASWRDLLIAPGDSSGRGCGCFEPRPHIIICGGLCCRRKSGLCLIYCRRATLAGWTVMVLVSGSLIGKNSKLFTRGVVFLFFFYGGSGVESKRWRVQAPSGGSLLFLW